MPNNYDVNYEDERFDQVESDKEQAMTETQETYDNMIQESDSYYDAQIKASQDWADKQSQLQQEQTDFAIEQIEQQKEQAQKDYVKEQSGAYADWQKQSNRYGVEAERQASVGMDGTGFSESSQVGMYNTYQNRVATARESYGRAVLNYDNAIKDARLQNNSKLAEIAYQSLQTQLELALQGFQYKNQLILDQANKKLELENIYYQRYLDVLNQINHENSLDEQIRQYNQDYEFRKQQAEEDKRRWEAEMELQKSKYSSSSDSSSDGDDEYKILKTSNSNSTKNTRTVKKGAAGDNYQVQIDGNGDGNEYDWGTLSDIGLGDISAAELAWLIDRGYVMRTKKNGQWYYSRGEQSLLDNWLKKGGK